MRRDFEFESANSHQADSLRSTALSAVNALSIASGRPWDDVFHLLEDQAVYYGQMPDCITCTEGLIAAMGYAPAHKPRLCGTQQEVSDWLLSEYPGISSAIVISVRDKEHYAFRRVQALLPAEDPAGKKLIMHDTKSGALFHHILKVYLPSEETRLPVFVPPLHPAYRHGSTPENHFGYMYFQPNPRQNAIGDCVIRAYAAVLNVDWGTALRQLARSCELNLTSVNAGDVYQYLLSELHCTWHEAIRVNGHPLRGIDFCARMNARYHSGERIFVNVGPHHVAAVIPDPEAKVHPRYVIADAWDSSHEYFGAYWVYMPPAETKQEEPESRPLAGIHEGLHIVHPRYGDGAIRSLDEKSDRCIVRFSDGAERPLSATWVLQKCIGA